MDPNERDLLLQFLWTRDEVDMVDTPEKLKGWLVGLELLDPETPVTDEDVTLARHLRAATRSLCTTHKGLESDPRTRAIIDKVNEAAPLLVTLNERGQFDVTPGGTGVPKALATFLAIGYKATVAGEFWRFKACLRCGWAFYDESKNGSKKWCAMGSCGTRSKMKAYRERKKAGLPAGPQ
jgi:predicted RNA-binding Zn ribbon-like protein